MTTDCIIWQGHINDRGYGEFHRGVGGTRSAHRQAYDVPSRDPKRGRRCRTCHNTYNRERWRRKNWGCVSCHHELNSDGDCTYDGCSSSITFEDYRDSQEEL